MEMGSDYYTGNDHSADSIVGFGNDLSRWRKRDIGTKDDVPSVADHDCLGNIGGVWFL